MLYYLKWFLAILTFFAELALWGGVGRVVWRQFSSINPKIAIFAGILGAAVVVVLWGMFLSPRSKNRVSLIPRIIIISIMTIVTGYLLYKGGDKNFGLIMIIGLTLIQAFGQYFTQGME